VSFDLGAYMKERAAAVDVALDRFLTPETERPESLHKAMRYSGFAGGKRLRPVLVIAGAEAVGGTAERGHADRVARLELVHTYSLVHDDLPRDGQRRLLAVAVPTNHKVFGEATAILAGDALLTLAFRLVADNARATSLDALQAVVVDPRGRGGPRRHGGRAGGRSEAEGRQVGAGHGGLHPRPTRPAPSSAPRSALARCSAGRRPSRLRALQRGRGGPGPGVPDRRRHPGRGRQLGGAGQDRGQGPDPAEGDLPGDPRHRALARRAPASWSARPRRPSRDSARGPSPFAALGRFILERKA